MKIINKTKLTISASIIAGLATGCASDPFAQKDLASGYMNEAESSTKQAKEAACGEGKCGAAHATEEAKAEAAKAVEGKCGEGKCGEK